jgi:hypothetical protein
MPCSTARPTRRPKVSEIQTIRRRIARLLRSWRRIHSGCSCRSGSGMGSWRGRQQAAGRHLAVATAHRKRQPPRAPSRSANTSSSSGPQGLRNLACATCQPPADRRRAAWASCITRSSSTTPGTMGCPGKWPAKAGWSAGTRQVAQCGHGHHPVGGTAPAKSLAAACRCCCAAGRPRTPAGAAGTRGRCAGAAPPAAQAPTGRARPRRRSAG